MLFALRSRRVLHYGAGLLLLALAACGGGVTLPRQTAPSSGGSNSATSSASSTQALVAGQPIAIPPIGGFSGTLTFAPGTTIPSGATVALQSFIGAAPGAPAPQSKARRPLAVSGLVTIASFTEIFSALGISAPTWPLVSYILASSDPAGPYTAETFDENTNTEIWSLTVQSTPTTLNGGMEVNFNVPNVPFVPVVGHTYITNVVSGTGTAFPAPTPSPAPSPTGSSTPSAYTACPGSHLYVNDDFGGLVSYSLPLTSASPPTQLESAGQTVWVAFDPKCNAYITQYFGAVQEFANPYTGAPIASYTGASGGDPYGVAVDNSGHVFIDESQANIVIELSSISGTVINTIPVTGPYSIALDSNANLYVGGANGISVFAPPYSSTTPIQTILAGTGVQGIAFDAKNTLFAVGNNTLTVLAPPYGTGNVIATNTQGLATPLGLAVDSSGNVYAPNYGANTITAYAPPYTGAPFATLAGNLPDGASIGP